MADIVTDGRIVMGVGRGYHTREVESFGAPLLDAEKNRDLFEEGASAPAEVLQRTEIPPQGPLLRGAAPGAVPRLHGEDITLVPRPKHLPVDIYMPIASGKTIEMMAKYGLKAMVTLNGEKILDDVLRAYQAAFAKRACRKSLARM